MYKRVVVKVGTKVLSKDDGTLDGRVLKHLSEQISSLKKKNIEIILVTSGAVGSGRSLLTLKGKETVPNKQVYAAIGQVKLMNTYSKLFAKHGYLCAQVLATKEDFRDREHYLNMKNCLTGLLYDKVLPVVNENDVVAIAELIFTDNDELAGLVALQLKADAVIILSSTAGVLDGSLRVIPEITGKTIASFRKYVTSAKSTGGRGGMVSKFAVARKLMSRGIQVHIADGKRKNVLSDIMKGTAIGTKFVPGRKIKR
ncbi:glutamate 5-kinase [Candidatus Kaiserbacteria bacterium]|nr:glutamate 5-kinase [Candidatus Kaiserbacteria bacterium]